MKSTRNNIVSIDVLNIVMILVSLLIAFKLPFELFLFSYAVLGPLHYLTEITWLKEKNYYVREHKWTWVFILAAVLLTILLFYKTWNTKILNAKGLVGYLNIHSFKVFNVVLFILFLFSFGLLYLEKFRHILIAFLVIIISVGIVILFNLFPVVRLTLFLPTIIHVYVFTLLFMIYGAMKSKSLPGMISCAFLLLSPFIISASIVHVDNYHVSEVVKSTFFKSDFQNVDTNLAIFLGITGNNTFYFSSQAGIKIQIFVAFCYTYHYLNWFSKVSVIRWNKSMSKLKTAALIVLWICSIALYMYDYKIGFVALFALSLIHVFLEFPLNILTIRGIITGIINVGKPAE